MSLRSGRAPDFTRAYPLEDIQIRSGDGRTVEAYAAVFDTPVPISDRDGRYLERIAPTAFNKTIADNGTKFGVLFNHGLTVHGTPAERYSMPLGVPIEVKVQSRGVLTVTRYHQTDLADEVLENIRSGAIRAQSFSGSFIRSDPPTPRGGHRAAPDGSLTEVTRQEVRMIEYGPAVFAAYEDAAIVGVRAEFSITPADKAVLTMLLADLAEGDAVLDPIVAQAATILSVDSALDMVQYYLAQLLGEPDPDDDDVLVVVGSPDRSQVLHRLNALATRLGPMRAPGTPTGAAAPSRMKATTRLGLRDIAKKGLTT